MEEAAKLNGTTFREMFIDDVTNAAAKNWEKACSEKSYLKKSKKKGSDSKMMTQNQISKAKTRLISAKNIMLAIEN